MDLDAQLFKIGDGVSDWNTLQFSGSPLYTEDDPADADPGGYMNMAVRADTLAAVTDTDGDNIALRSTNKGELYVKQTDVIDVNVTGGSITVGTVEITNDAGNPIPVSATDLDIRNLVFATDKVDVSGSTLSANSGVDIGDVTINNAAGASAVNIQDGGNSITVDLISTTITGTVAVTQSGTWDEIGINDSGNSITVDAPIGTPVNVIIGDATRTATVRDTGASDSLNVSIVDASGNQVTSFGGAGTEYTEGDTDATITGMAVLMEVGSNVLQPIQGTVADGLLVNLGGNNDVTVTGTVAVTQSGTWDEVGINDSGNSITVDNPQLSVVGGGVETTALRVTIASDSTGELSVDDNGGTLTVDGTIAFSNTTIAVTNAGTFAVQESGAALTALQLIDDPVAVLGTATYTEASSKGFIVGAVRRDADTTLVDTTNEISPLQVDANGRLKVEVFSGETLPVSLTSTTITGTVAVTQSGTWDEVGINDSGNSITVDNGGTFAVQDSEKLADNAGFTDGTTKLQPIGFIYDEVAGTALTENDIAAARIDVKRATVGVIEDGVTRGRYANVLDLTNSNPVTTAIVDANGDQITSFGGGTQYTEDAVAAADPIGTATILVRSDTPGALVTTNGDNVAQRGTNYGAAYTQIVSSAGAFVDTFGGGTQYTEGDTDATITGNVMLMEVAANVVQPIQGTVADGLLVNLGTNNDVTLATLPEVDATKTVGTSVMALQTVSASSVATSSVVSTANKLGATIFIHFGREAVTAAGVGVNIRIEASSKASLNGHWYPLATFTTGFATCETEALTATEPAGETVVAVGSTTNLTAGELIFIFNTTIGSSEWHRIKSVSPGVSVTLEDGLLFEQTAAASDIFDLAEMFVAQLDLTSVSRLRVVADGSLFTQAFAIEVDMISWDSVG